MTAPSESPSLEVTGTPVSGGRVVGPARVMASPAPEPTAGATLAPDADAEAEAQRIKDAAGAVKASLTERAERATGSARDVLKATALMAADPTLAKSAMKLVRTDRRTPERAVWESAEAVIEQLTALGGYMAERTADVKDVRARIVAELRGEPAPGIPVSDEPFVLIAEDLAPADTATLDPGIVLALVTSDGGPQSHTAILARQLGLPAVVAARGADEVPSGTEVYVDGAAGLLTTSVTDERRAAAAAYAERAANPLTFDGEGRLADGRRIPLRANIGSAADARAAAAAKAEGVGLFRTEFLFLDRADEPSVEEQTASYAEAFGAFAEVESPKIVVRTLDAGADKPLPFLTEAGEPNPALGVRGYRTRSRSLAVLTNQLEAISAAARQTGADVWVMAPMIATVEESEDFAALCAEAGLKHAGVMIEVPSAALRARSVLRSCEFASIGTNDLTQYTMAADRMLGALAELNDPWQPGVLALIRATAEGAAAAATDTGAPRSVGVCGEAAADPALAAVLVGLGVDSLSMTPRALPAVAAVLASVSTEEARTLAEVALESDTAAEARTAVRARLPILDELGL
ncbi:phosphoenolpyruvate--protein phosphotransferase [Falsarthrobacter nasiphocae]|uniref:Phosphoenolpyruvate-protein phosphotransferase n=1 Tax=Falsarthrobacter nasiphocae TaxID=189863 RepID=A0AAE3YHJ8_9MICC|nr:phosphoenolpyruvate--protein phosphotransferase [Falsarthrobacter nasiphocae]MDR6892422.1 phosphotransferase system enzyme I (PtsI) [Falsarthrobacter nasiphocae]